MHCFNPMALHWKVSPCSWMSAGDPRGGSGEPFVNCPERKTAQLQECSSSSSCSCCCNSCRDVLKAVCPMRFLPPRKLVKFFGAIPVVIPMETSKSTTTIKTLITCDPAIANNHSQIFFLPWSVLYIMQIFPHKKWGGNDFFGRENTINIRRNNIKAKKKMQRLQNVALLK